MAASTAGAWMSAASMTTSASFGEFVKLQTHPPVEPIQCFVGGGSMPAPLAGLSVLDLSQGISGPFCAKLLGDLGADVLKL
ncbi:MAG: CoA transferase, partial [Dehalococcoidia bacterium]